MITSGSARSIERRPLAKVRPDLAFTCSWLMPGELVLDRVLDRDDVLVDRVDRVQRGVERGGLARARRAGDQHGAVRLAKAGLEPLARLAEQAEGVEAEHRLALVEDSHHDALAVHRGQGHDADVDRVALDLQADPAVLGDALLGDVEVAHDLHARDHAGDHPARDRGGLAEHAVDAEAHAHVAAVGLEVQVGCAGLHRLGDHRVHELDDRGVLRPTRGCR